MDSIVLNLIMIMNKEVAIYRDAISDRQIT